MMIVKDFKKIKNNLVRINYSHLQSLFLIFASFAFLISCSNSKISISSMGLQTSTINISQNSKNTNEIISDELGQFTFQLECAKGMKSVEISHDDAKTWTKIQDINCPEDKTQVAVIYNPTSLVNPNVLIRTNADWGDSVNLPIQLTQPLSFTISGTPTSKVNLSTMNFNLTFQGTYLKSIKYKVASSDEECSISSNYSSQNVESRPDGFVELKSQNLKSMISDGNVILCIVGVTNKDFTERKPQSGHILKWTQDTRIPSVAFTSPAPASYLNANNKNNFTLQGTCSEDNQSITITATDMTNTHTKTTICETFKNPEWSVSFDFSNLSLNEGFILFKADMNDSGGNSATQTSLSIIKDTIAVQSNQILLTDRGNGTTSGLPANSSPFTRFAIEVSGDQVTHYKYKFGLANTTNCSLATGYSSTWKSISTLIEDDFSNLIDSNMNLCLITKDTAGNEQSPSQAKVVTWNKQTGAVVATLQPSTMDTPTKITSATFTVSGSNIVSYKYKIGSGNTSICSNSSGYSANFISTSTPIVIDVSNNTNFPNNTSVTLCVIGKDNSTPAVEQSLNTASTVSWVKDTVAPTIEITSPSSNSYINISNNSSTFNISGTCSEQNKTVTFKLNSSTTLTSTGGVCNGTSFTAGVDVTSINEGNNKLITAHLTDEAGNSSISSPITLTKDITEPSLAWSSPNNGSYINASNSSTTFNLSGTCSSSDSGRPVSVTMGTFTLTTTGTCSGTSFTATINTTDASKFSQGALSLYAHLTDLAGNSKTSPQLSLNYDTLNPLITISTPSSGTTYLGINSATQFIISGSCESSETGQTVTLKKGSTILNNTATCTGSTYSTQLDTTTLSAGTHNVFVTINDNASNSSTSNTITLIRDTTAPTIAISNTINGTYINLSNSASFTIHGTCSDVGRPISLFASGSPLTAVGLDCSSNNDFSTSLDLSSLSENTHNLTAKISDLASNETTSSAVTVIKDTTRPLGSNINLNDESNNVGVNGLPISTSPLTALRLSLSGDLTNYLYKFGPASDVICANDNNASPTDIDYTTNWSAVATLLSGDLSAFSDGPMRLCILPSDAAGNTALYSAAKDYTWTKDTSGAIAILTPANVSSPNKNNNFTFNVSGAGLVSYKYKVITGTTNCAASAGGYSGALDAATVPITVNASGFADETITVCVLGIDNLANEQGETEASSVSWTRDTTAPSLISITSPDHNSYINSQTDENNFSISGSCSEIGRTVAILVNNTSVTQVGGNCSEAQIFTATISTATLPDNNSLQIKAQISDVAGNTSTSSPITINKDTTAPTTLTITSPSNNSYINASSSSSTFSLSGNCSENTKVVKLKKDGSLIATTGGTCNGSNYSLTFDTTSGFADHTTYLLTTEIQDSASNTKTSSAVSVTFDISLPSISITSPTAQQFINISQESPTFAISGLCDASGRTVSIYNNDGSSNDLISNNGSCNGTTFSSTFNTSNLSEGSNSLTAQIQDAAGNSNTSSTVIVVKDTSLPTIALTTPNTNTYINGDSSSLFYDSATYGITGTCSEANRPITLTIDGSSNHIISTSCSPTFTFSTTFDSTKFSETSHSLQASISDLAGNSKNSTAKVFYRDITPPTSIILNVPAPNYINYSNNSTQYQFTGSCTETSMVQNVTLFVDNNPVTTTNGICNGTSFTAELNSTTLSNGTHSFKAQITDTAQNKTLSTSFDMLVDKIKPTGLAISVYPSISNQNKTNYIASGTCGTASGDSSTLELTIGSLTAYPTCLGDGTWTTSGLNFDVSSLNDSSNLTLILTQTDHVNNSSSVQRTNIKKDTTAPVISTFSVTAPSVAQPINNTSLTLSVTATDSMSSLFNACLIEKQHGLSAPNAEDCNSVWSSPVATNAITQFTLSGTQGLSDLYLFIKDENQNISSYYVIENIDFDNIAPALVTPLAEKPSDGIHGTGTQLDFTFNLTDAHSVSLNTTSGTSYLDITIGSNLRQAKLITPAGSSITQLKFRYTTTADDFDIDGIVISTIHLNNSVIKDTAQNIISLTYTPPDLSGVKINDAPTISGTCSTSATTGLSYSCSGLSSTDASKTNLTWSLDSGSCSWATVTNASTGVIGGTPSSDETCNLKVLVYDGLSYSSPKIISVTSTTPPPDPALTQGTIDLYTGTEFTFTAITTNGGTIGKTIAIENLKNCELQTPADGSKISIVGNCSVSANALQLHLLATQRQITVSETVIIKVPLSYDNSGTPINKEALLAVNIKPPIITTISSSNQNINLFSLLTSAGTSVTNIIDAYKISGQPMSFKFKVNGGVEIGSTSSSLPSIDSGAASDFPPKSWIILDIDGLIIGKGGNGGRGAYFDGSSIVYAENGSPGGPALKLQAKDNLELTYDVIVNSTGSLSGGAGGGGGGGASCIMNDSTLVYCAGASGGGGAGSGGGLGGASTSGSKTVDDDPLGYLATQDDVGAANNGSLLIGGVKADNSSTLVCKDPSPAGGGGNGGSITGLTPAEDGENGYANSCTGHDPASLNKGTAGSNGVTIIYEVDSNSTPTTQSTSGLANGDTLRIHNGSLSVTSGSLSF